MTTIAPPIVSTALKSTEKAIPQEIHKSWYDARNARFPAALLKRRSHRTANPISGQFPKSPFKNAMRKPDTNRAPLLLINE